MRSLSLLLFLLTLMLPQAGQSQTVAIYERWIIYQQVIVTLKPLPAGFMHFAPVSADIAVQRMSSDGGIFCGDMQTAISFGKRLGLGLSPDGAAQEMSRAWAGAVPCGYKPGLTLRAVEYAIRGDDKGRKIWIVKWKDQFETEHFTGVPRGW